MTNDTSSSPQSDEKLPGAGDCTWTETRFKVFEFCHKWTIHKFSCLKMKTGDDITSSVFGSNSNDAVKWKLRLYPHGQTEATEAYLSFYLHLIHKHNAVNAEYVLSIIDASGKITNDVLCNYAFTQSSGYGEHEFIERAFLEQNKDKLLSGDKLVLLCKGSYTTDLTVASGSTDVVKFPIPESKALNDFGCLLGNQQFCDVTLDVSGTEFHAHKAILSARSTVFAGMFNNEMRELKENRVTIKDTDPQVFGELLRFIYTDNAQNLEDIAAKLICVADKYDVLRLKKLCAAALFESLSVDNASDTLILADLHNAEELKKMTLEFISSHTQAVMNTDSYKSMFQTHPQLVAEALTAVVLRQMGTLEQEKSQLDQ